MVAVDHEGAALVAAVAAGSAVVCHKTGAAEARVERGVGVESPDGEVVVAIGVAAPTGDEDTVAGVEGDRAADVVADATSGAIVGDEAGTIESRIEYSRIGEAPERHVRIAECVRAVAGGEDVAVGVDADADGDVLAAASGSAVVYGPAAVVEGHVRRAVVVVAPHHGVPVEAVPAEADDDDAPVAVEGESVARVLQRRVAHVARSIESHVGCAVVV